MRFLLVNPYYPISETPSPPLGLAFLGAALEQAGVEVRLLDLVVSPYNTEMLESVLREFTPHMVGATSVTMTFDNAIEVLKDVKRIDPDVLTVMGGPHVSFCARDTMTAFPCVDLIALGEGEETIVELAMEANGRLKWDSVKGIVYRSGSEIISTGLREFVPALDDLPVPARHLIPLGRYRALGMPISMTTSRGCPFRCIFCVGRKMTGARVRYRDPKKVFDELAHLSTLGFHQVNIADDLFTSNRGHCLSVCDEIIRNNLKIKWTSFARVDTVSKDLLERMKKAGCAAVSFGVESANARILKTIKKGITTDQVITAVKMCRDAGITPHASFILGLPGETPETLKETVDFGERLKQMGVSHGFHLLAPFPGTEVREKNERLGLKILTSDWRQYHANRAIVETDSVTRAMLDEIVLDWENRFNEYLGEIGRLSKIGEAGEDEAWQLKRLEHTIIIYDLMMGRIIEKNGSWTNGNRTISDKDALNDLVDRVAGAIDYTRKQVYETLEFSRNQGNLRCRQDKNRVRWEWVDFL